MPAWYTSNFAITRLWVWYEMLGIWFFKNQLLMHWRYCILVLNHQNVLLEWLLRKLEQENTMLVFFTLVCMHSNAFKMSSWLVIQILHFQTSRPTLRPPAQSSRMDFMLHLPNCTDRHQMLIILPNSMSDIWILRLTKQTCWRDFGKTACLRLCLMVANHQKPTVC